MKDKAKQLAAKATHAEHTEHYSEIRNKTVHFESYRLYNGRSSIGRIDYIDGNLDSVSLY